MSCKSCNINTNNLYNNGTYCYLCNIVYNTRYYNIKNIIICFSNLSQLEIIKLTREYIQKNNKIPTPNEIDKDCKIIIKVNHYILSTVINKFNNLRIFITDIDISKIKILKIFDKIIKNKTNITYNYTFNDIEKDIYNKYYLNYINKCKNNIKNLYIN